MWAAFIECQHNWNALLCPGMHSETTTPPLLNHHHHPSLENITSKINGLMRADQWHLDMLGIYSEYFGVYFEMRDTRCGWEQRSGAQGVGVGGLSSRKTHLLHQTWHLWPVLSLCRCPGVRLLPFPARVGHSLSPVRSRDKINFLSWNAFSDAGFRSWYLHSQGRGGSLTVLIAVTAF